MGVSPLKPATLKSYPPRKSGWMDKLDRGMVQWEHGHKLKYVRFERSALLYSDDNADDAVLGGSLDLRMAEVLRSSE
jgi:hypothetical protein